MTFRARIFAAVLDEVVRLTKKKKKKGENENENENENKVATLRSKGRQSSLRHCSSYGGHSHCFIGFCFVGAFFAFLSPFLLVDLDRPRVKVMPSFPARKRAARLKPRSRRPGGQTHTKTCWESRISPRVPSEEIPGDFIRPSPCSLHRVFVFLSLVLIDSCELTRLLVPHRDLGCQTCKRPFPFRISKWPLKYRASFFFPRKAFFIVSFSLFLLIFCVESQTHTAFGKY